MRAALGVVFTELVDVVRISRAGNCAWGRGIVVGEHLEVGGTHIVGPTEWRVGIIVGETVEGVVDHWSVVEDPGSVCHGARVAKRE